MTRRPQRAAQRHSTAAIAVRAIVFTTLGPQLGVRLRQAEDDAGGDDWELPSAGPEDESLERCAHRLVQACTKGASFWLEQLRTSEVPSGGADRLLVVDYVALVPAESPDDGRGEIGGREVWFPVAGRLPISALQRDAVKHAVASIRSRAEQEPVAFRLLPAAFTLSELQGVYELLVGQPLHKASFRRALLAAHLVEATREQRQDRRGRPAQLYRYAPGAPRGEARGVRFDRLTQ